MGVKKGEKNPNYPKTRKSRYYSSPYNNSLKVKDTFAVPETQELINIMYDACGAYCSTRQQSQVDGYKRILGLFVLGLNKDFDVKDINGEYLVNFYENSPGRRECINPVSKDLIYNFLTLNKKYGWHPELDIVAENTFPFWSDIKNLQYLIIPLLDGRKDPRKCRLLKAESVNKGHNLVLSLIEFDTDNRFIQDLLIEYHHSQHTVQPRVYQLDFFRRFAESLDYQLPSDIYGFNADTLLKQEKFFVAIRREPELENRFFYRFILNKQGEQKTITINDGISLGYLMSENFVGRYSDGYRYIPINPNEPVPESDKWAISPNGLEQAVASDKPEHIRYIDFTRISEKVIRDAAKAWFWSESKAGFENRQRNALYIIEFFEYRDKLRSMYFDKFAQARAGTDLDLQHTVLSEEVISYTNEWNEVLTAKSYASRFVPLKLFLQYMNDADIYRTEIAAFEYLNTSGKGTKPKQEILPVPKDDFMKLIAKLEEKAQNNTLHMLYYIVFCLNALTPLRISSILDLHDDCLVEKSKGIYALEVKVKTSDGDEKDIQISKEVKRLVEVALSLTKDTRNNAPTEQKHYLFLVNNQKDFYRSIPSRSYAEYLYNSCDEAGIPRYSAQNLRKTYYTNLIENAIKNNVSLMSLKELTGHANIDTTENYYVKENIRNYLEATYGVEIGNMPVVGTVASEYPEAKHEDIVNDGCGYCRNPECNVLGTANCLMCKGFITTPKHIAQFEEAINILSQQIVDNENLHDKEHLYAVKRLYAAYLEQLYIRKEEAENAATIS
jgi:integrase